jgi:hypothetical protein
VELILTSHGRRKLFGWFDGPSRANGRPGGDRGRSPSAADLAYADEWRNDVAGNLQGDRTGYIEALELLRIQTAPQGSRIRVELSSSARREDLLSVQILDTSCNLL